MPSLLPDKMDTPVSQLRRLQAAVDQQRVVIDAMRQALTEARATLVTCQSEQEYGTRYEVIFRKLARIDEALHKTADF